MDSLIFIIIIAVVIISILLISFFFSKKAVIIRKLKNAESKKIAEFKDNDIAKVIGFVEIMEEPLIAPLSGRKCAYYYIHIEQRVSSGKNSRWKTVIEEEVSSNFLIRTENSYAFINDNNMKCYIVQDRNYSSGFLNDAEENLENYLNKKGYKSEGVFGLNKSLRYKEGILESDEKIAVLGKGKWKDYSSLKLPEKFGRVLEITSYDNVAIYLSDDPKTTLKKTKEEKGLKRYNTDEKNYRK